MPLSQSLRVFGWIESQNFVIDYLFDDGKHDRLPAFAAELVDRKADVPLVRGTPAALAAKGATTCVPIVMVYVADPVGSGLVSRLRRSEGS